MSRYQSTNCRNIEGDLSTVIVPSLESTGFDVGLLSDGEDDDDEDMIFSKDLTSVDLTERRPLMLNH